MKLNNRKINISFSGDSNTGKTSCILQIIENNSNWFYIQEFIEKISNDFYQGQHLKKMNDISARNFQEKLFNCHLNVLKKHINNNCICDRSFVDYAVREKIYCSNTIHKELFINKCQKYQSKYIDLTYVFKKKFENEDVFSREVISYLKAWNLNYIIVSMEKSFKEKVEWINNKICILNIKI